MTITYFKATDTLYISFNDNPIEEKKDISENILIELDKNKNIVWNRNPTSADYTLGIGRSSTTSGEAEKNGVGSYIDIQLNKGDYVIIVADDSQGDFGDNRGSINVSVSIIAP